MPCSPKVINTADIPKSRKYVAVSFISLSLLIEIPVNNSASVSFGIIISVNSKSDLGNSIAGAGFNTVVIFCLRAILNACSIASNGTSSCAITKSAPINASALISTSVALNVIFAPP